MRPAQPIPRINRTNGIFPYWAW